MIYQVVWKTEPGLRGMSCSAFRAVPTGRPDTEQGVAVECVADGERDALLRELEQQFASQRFSNNASAFETVKSFVLDWAAKRAAAGNR